MKFFVLFALLAAASAMPTTKPEEETGKEIPVPENVEADAVDMVTDEKAKAENDAVEKVMETPEMEQPGTADEELEKEVASGPMVMETGEEAKAEEDQIPEAPKNSVRRQIGEMKMRFLHAANHEALKKILLRPAVLGFWRATFKFQKNKNPISTEEWTKMWNILDNYWSKHLGVKIPVTLENWMAVNKDKNGHISVKDEIIPTLFFEKDRFLFDVIFSALFERVFDFNKNGLLDSKVFKEIKGNRLSEPKFFFRGVQWVKDIMSLPTASAQEIQTELDTVAKEQGPEMAQEMIKNLEIDGQITPKEERVVVAANVGEVNGVNV